MVNKEEQVTESFDSVDFVIKKRNEEKKRRLWKKRKQRLALSTVVFLFVFVGYLYYSSNISKIKLITISGNEYLSKDYILQKSDLNYDSLHLLTIPYFVENNIKKDPLISSVKVKVGWDRIVHIEVTEKRLIGYQFIEEGLLLLEDGSTVVINEDYMPLLIHIPFIDGFKEETLQKELAKAFANVDNSILQKISEIHQYETSYDTRMIEVVMQDGNKIYSSVYSLESINHYYDIVSNLNINNGCIFIDEVTGSAYSKPCTVEGEENTPNDSEKEPESNEKEPDAE